MKLPFSAIIFNLLLSVLLFLELHFLVIKQCQLFGKALYFNLSLSHIYKQQALLQWESFAINRL